MAALNIEHSVAQFTVDRRLPTVMSSVSDSHRKGILSSNRKSKVVVAVSPFIPSESSIPERVRRNKPLNFEEIKRKLAFDEEEDGKEKDLDFTDKLTALRSMFTSKQRSDHQISEIHSASKVGTVVYQSQEQNMQNDCDVVSGMPVCFEKSVKCAGFLEDSHTFKASRQYTKVDRMKFKDIGRFSSDRIYHKSVEAATDLNNRRSGDNRLIGTSNEHSMHFEKVANMYGECERKTHLLSQGNHRSDKLNSSRRSSLELTSSKNKSGSKYSSPSRRSHVSNLPEYYSRTSDNLEIHTNNNYAGDQGKTGHFRSRSDKSSHVGNNSTDREFAMRSLKKQRESEGKLETKVVQTNLSFYQPDSPAKVQNFDSVSASSHSGKSRERALISNSEDISEGVYIAGLLQSDFRSSLKMQDGKQTNVNYYVGTSPERKIHSNSRSPLRHLDACPSSSKSRGHSSSVSPGCKRERHTPKKSSTEKTNLYIISPNKPLTLAELSDSPKLSRKKKHVQSNIRSESINCDSDSFYKSSKHRHKNLDLPKQQMTKPKDSFSSTFGDKFQDSEMIDFFVSGVSRLQEDLPDEFPEPVLKQSANGAEFLATKNTSTFKRKEILDSDSRVSSAKSDVSLCLNEPQLHTECFEKRKKLSCLADVERNGLESFSTDDVQQQVRPESRLGVNVEEDVKSRMSSNSISGSTETVDCLTSTIHTVHFMRRLYEVDDRTRERLILQAKYFWHWRKTAQKMKKKHIQSKALEKESSSSVNFSTLLNSATVFYRRTLIVRYFLKWKNNSRSLQKFATATALHRRHLMRKGLQALMFAMNRSKLQQDMLIKKIEIIQKSTIFYQWQDKARQNRRQRLASAFQRWHEFAMEAQRFRLLRRRAERKVLIWAIDLWKERYQERLQEKRAYLHHRRLQLVESIRCWKAFTVTTKVKKDKQLISATFHDEKLRRSTFMEMKVVYEQYQRSKKHYRSHKLHQMLLSWKQGSYLLKAERQRDMSTSREHWRITTIHGIFVAWHEKLLLKRACQVSDTNTKRYMLHCWYARWIEQVQMRQSVEAEEQRELLRRCLKNLFCNVQALKRHRQLAVACIERVLARHTLCNWIEYARNRNNMRRNLLQLINKVQKRKQKTYLTLWRTRLRVQLDRLQARKRWSDACVRKASDQWLKVCYHRRLENLLTATEPLRELQQQRVIFQHWLSAFNEQRDEKREAVEARSRLQMLCLQRFFQKWRLSTQYMLIIKPLLQRVHRQIVTRTFDGWLNFVKHKIACKRNQQLFQRMVMRQSFGVWRRQYLICQLESDVIQKTLRRKLRQCFLGWHSVIQQKHAADEFHREQLVGQAFLHWRTRVVRQLHKKADTREKQIERRCILRHYFFQWQTGNGHQMADDNENMLVIQHLQTRNRQQLALVAWRQHFRSTLLARENHRILHRRLLRHVLLQWLHTTRHSMQDAVEVFATRLGLQGDSHTSDNVSGTSSSGVYSNRDFRVWAGSIPEQLQQLADFDSEADMISISQGDSPYSSSIGTPIRRLFSPPMSRMSPRQSLDCEHPEINHPALLNNSLLDARFAMEQAVRTDRLRDIVTRAITKLRFWPLSLAFDQWKEYTNRQRELKTCYGQLVLIHQQTVQNEFFKCWRVQQIAMVKAKVYRQKVLQKKSFRALLIYKESRQMKQQLSCQARKHYARHVYNEILPIWRAKNEARQYRKRILHLWTNITNEEQLLVPLELRITSRLAVKTVRLCFSVWVQRYKQRTRLKLAVHKILLQRCFVGWKVWACGRRDRRLKFTEFSEHRLQSQAYKRWCVRLEQKLEVERRHEEVWHCYLVQIVGSWHHWAAVTRQHRMLAKQIVQNLDHHALSKHFYNWRSRVQKHKQVTEFHKSHIQTKIFKAWHRFSILQKDLKNRFMIFQITHSLHLEKQTFHAWHERYIQRLHHHQKHDQLVQQRALFLGQMWRRKAQSSRGRLLFSLIQKRKVHTYFDKWKAAHWCNQHREYVLMQYIMENNRCLVASYLSRWRACLLSVQATQLHNTKLVSTVMMDWHAFAVGSKERRLSCQTLEKVCQKRLLRSHFTFWSRASQVQVSVKHNYTLKLQIQTMREWHHYAQRQKMLCRLQDAFLYKHNHGILKNTWQVLMLKFQQCQKLEKTAEKVTSEKKRKCLRQALSVWEHQLNCAIADRYYRHLVTIRAIRQWQNFVHNNKQERQRMLQLMAKAQNYYEKQSCKRVLNTWFSEVLVSRQICKHRTKVTVKCGLLWKLRVDQQYTAMCMDKESCLKLVWKYWRLAFVRRQATTKLEKYEQKQLLARIFGGWKKLCLKKNEVRMCGSDPASTQIQFLNIGNPTTDLPTEFEPMLSPRPSLIPTPKYSVTGPQTSGSNGGRFRARTVNIKLP